MEFFLFPLESMQGSGIRITSRLSFRVKFLDLRTHVYSRVHLCFQGVCIKPISEKTWLLKNKMLRQYFIQIKRTFPGPVINMYEESFTMNVKSVNAGEYTAPPAHGPIIIEIWGTTPDAITLRLKWLTNKKNPKLFFILFKSRLNRKF